MAARRLKPNQMDHRASSIYSFISGVEFDQVLTILDDAHVLEVLREHGMLGDSAPAPAPAAGQEDMDALYKQAVVSGLKRADPQMARHFDDVSSRERNVQAFDLRVFCIPYRIADASLTKIVLEADETTVREMLHAIVERSELDGCPKSLVTSLMDVIRDWFEWEESRGGLSKAQKTPEVPPDELELVQEMAEAS